MKRTSIAFLVMLCLFAGVVAQTPADSLKTALQSATAVEERINILNQLAYALNYADTEAATQYAIEALELANASGKMHLLGKSYRNLAIIHKNTGLTETAMAYADSALWCYETEMAQLENNRLSEEKSLPEMQSHRNRQRLNVFIVALALVFVVIGLIYMHSRSKEHFANMFNITNKELPVKNVQAEKLKQKLEQQFFLISELDAHHWIENPASTNALTFDLLNTNLDDVRQQFITSMKKTVIQHISNPDFGIRQLREKAFLGERQLRRKITEITGLPPLEFIRQIRLFHAKRLLEQHTHQTIAEVSAAVGFNNPAYFSRLFKKRFGMSPHELFVSKPG